jgi:hypothetical protein
VALLLLLLLLRVVVWELLAVEADVVAVPWARGWRIAAIK